MRATVTKIVARRLAFARRVLSRAADNDKGATTIEYAILIGMMALVCVASFTALGGAVSGRWNNVATAVAAATK